MDLTTGLAIIGAISATISIIERTYSYGSRLFKKTLPARTCTEKMTHLKKPYSD